MRIFISACRSTHTIYQNQFALVQLARRIIDAGLTFDVALGVYPEEGQQISTEVTFVVNVPNAEGMSARHIEECAVEWAELARSEFQQDCVGVLHDGEFYLAWPCGQPLEHIGKFKRHDAQPVGVPCTQWGGQWYAASKEVV